MTVNRESDVQSSTELRVIHLALERLVRGDRPTLSSFLQDFEMYGTVDGTNVKCHCQFIKLDGNGRPRVKALIQEICTHIVDYTIPRSAISEAFRKRESTGSAAAITRLHNQARELFTRIANTGENGELLLFILAETILGLPQLICKMDLKTNTQIHYHGADGLHAGVDETTGKLALYWCESKIWGNLSAAIRDCFGSMSPLLNGAGGSGSPEERDLQLLQRHLDLDNPELENALKHFLDPTSPHFNSIEFRGIALIGFDYDKYPDTPNGMTVEAVAEEIEKNLPGWKNSLKTRVLTEKVEHFYIHVFCLPVPSAEQFRLIFRRELGLDHAN